MISKALEIIWFKKVDWFFDFALLFPFVDFVA